MVVADPEGLVKEFDEDNNSAQKTISWTCWYPPLMRFTGANASHCFLEKEKEMCSSTNKLVILLTVIGFVALGSWMPPASSASGFSAREKAGEEVYETFETDHPYTGREIAWEKVITSPGAGYISIHFAKFDLAHGDYVDISSPDGRYGYRYEGKGKKVRGGRAVLSAFWASHIPGDTAVVRLHVAGPSGGRYGFKIDKWVRGHELPTRNGGSAIWPESDFKVEAICGADDKEWAPCYYGKAMTAIYEKSKSVARLLVQGSWACTGWLLGSEGHLMTNYHCIESQDDADNTDYEFMAEGATCWTDCSGWFSCPGTVEAASGALVKSDYSLDYSLVLLPVNLTSTYGYLQFRDSLPDLGERIYIPQHPGAKGKQLAVLDDQSGDYCRIYSTDRPPCIGGPGDIGYYCDTQGGSSGSPVIAYDDHLVTALHHCAYCPNRGVPVPSIIDDLGADLPDDAIGDPEISCTLDLSLSFADDTLTLDFLLGATGDVTGNVYLHYRNEVMTLCSCPVSVTDPPVSISLSYSEFPHLGIVGVLATLVSDDGIICSDWETVDTGQADALSPPPDELIKLLERFRNS